MKWIAKYNDGTHLRQFNEDGSENLFGDINQDKLETFTIGNPYKQISVDLTNGTFNIAGNIINIDKLSNREEDYRLIYFRRVSVNIGTSGTDNNKAIKSFIGYQITIDGKNSKVMFSEVDNKISIHVE